jgi:hypothetical protein
MADQVVDSLVALLRVTREAERDVFGALDPEERADQPADCSADAEARERTHDRTGRDERADARNRQRTDARQQP